MIYFLTSSPCIQGASILNTDNAFVDHLKQFLPSSSRALFICSDPYHQEATDRFAQDMRDSFEHAGFNFLSYQVLDPRNDVFVASLILESDFIILAGGHVPTQNQYFQQIQLAKLIKDFDGVIMGISAGTMNCASTVYAQPEREGESIDPNYQRFLPGLGITDLMILPHYQMIKHSLLDEKRLFEDITYPDSYGNSFYLLRDGSYILGTKEQEVLYGEAYLLKDGIKTKICEQNQSHRMTQR